MHRFVPLLCLALLSLPLAAEKVDGNAGAYGFQMLKVPAGPAQAACAGTNAAAGADAMVFFANPAQGLVARTEAVTFAHTAWIFDTSMNSVAYARTQGPGSFGLGMRYLDCGSFDTRDETGERIGQYHPMDLDAAFNFGRRILPDHYIGLNVHLLYEKINTASSTGACADIGWTWLTPVQGLRAGVAAKYLGATSKMVDDSIDLPRTFEATVDKDFTVGAISSTAGLRVIDHADDDNLKLALGLNTHLLSMFDLRLGYKINYDAESFSAGFGVNWKRLRVDYAWMPFDEEGIKDVHLLGLSFLL